MTRNDNVDDRKVQINAPINLVDKLRAQVARGAVIKSRGSKGKNPSTQRRNTSVNDNGGEGAPAKNIYI